MGTTVVVRLHPCRHPQRCPVTPLERPQRSPALAKRRRHSAGTADGCSGSCAPALLLEPGQRPIPQRKHTCRRVCDSAGSVQEGCTSTTPRQDCALGMSCACREGRGCCYSPPPHGALPASPPPTACTGSRLCPQRPELTTWCFRGALTTIALGPEGRAARQGPHQWPPGTHESNEGEA